MKTLDTQLNWHQVENNSRLPLDFIAESLHMALLKDYQQEKKNGAWYVGDGFGITEDLRQSLARVPSERVLLINRGNNALERPFAVVISYRALQTNNYLSEKPAEVFVSGEEVGEEVIKALAKQLQYNQTKSSGP